MLTCRLLDLTDLGEVDRSYDIVVAASTVGRPFHTPFGRDTVRLLLRTPDPAMLIESWGAFDESGEMVGTGAFELPLLDNLSYAFAEVSVEPHRRRRGIGSSLLTAMVGTLAPRRRNIVNAVVNASVQGWQEHPDWRFAVKNGFTLANTEVHRILDLPVPAATLDQLAARAAPSHAAYRLEHYVGTVPDELLPSYCDLQNQLALDAPTGELEFEAERMTPEVWSERNDLLQKSGLVRWSALAVTHQGQVAAYSDLVLPQDQPEVAHQWGTLVSRAHRGHRLGMAVKVRNLRELQRHDPGRRRVDTSNAEVNQWMVAINEQLGFYPVELSIDVMRRLA